MATITYHNVIDEALEKFSGRERASKDGFHNNSLPKAGVFEFRPHDHVIESEDESMSKYDHLRIGVVDAPDSISLGRIQVSGVSEKSDEMVAFIQYDSEHPNTNLQGKWRMQVFPVNPTLTGFSHEKLLKYLHGRSFEAKEVEWFALPFKIDGYTTEELFNGTEKNLSLISPFKAWIIKVGKKDEGFLKREAERLNPKVEETGVED